MPNRYQSNERKLLRISRKIPLWTTFALSALLFLIATFSLRANNQNMVHLRQAVFDADKQNGDVETALRDLRQYVYTHMNTDLASGDNAIKPPIQLKYRYDRLVEAELAKNNRSNDLYNDAQTYCEAHIKAFLGRDKLTCVRQYLDEHSGDSKTAEINIPDDLYKFDFVSPRWSPDLAGWSLVCAIAVLFLSLIRLFIDRSIQRRLRVLS